MTQDRIDPPYEAGERAMLDAWLDYHRATLAMLDAWLDYHRATLAMKCDGLEVRRFLPQGIDVGITTRRIASFFHRPPPIAWSASGASGGFDPPRPRTPGPTPRESGPGSS